MVSIEDAPYYETKDGVTAFDTMYSQRRHFTEHIRYFTIKSLMGDLAGKTVLDMGCGDGRVCEKIIEWGASKVVGYDVSQAMIDKCKNRKIPRSEFAVGDCSELGKLENKYDIVTTIFVMHYMPNYDSLLAYVKSAYDNLKPGGWFCGIVSAFEDGHPLSGSIPIGNTIYKRQSHEEYSKVVRVFGDVDKPDIIMVHNTLYAATIQKVIKEAGFEKLEWRPFMISKEGRKYFSEKDVREQLTILRPFVAMKTPKK